VNLAQHPHGEPSEQPVAIDVTELAFYLNFTPSVDGELLVTIKGFVCLCY